MSPRFIVERSKRPRIPVENVANELEFPRNFPPMRDCYFDEYAGYYGMANNWPWFDYAICPNGISFDFRQSMSYDAVFDVAHRLPILSPWYLVSMYVIVDRNIGETL